jgi:methyl-accepting chemotaxis protein
MAQENLNFRIVAIDKTRAAFSSVRGGLQRVQRSVFNVRNAVVGLGGALALRHFAQDIDNLAKLSARLDVPIQSLQELRFAAAQTGTEATHLTTGFQRFTKSISEASTGLSTPLKAFEALGVEITNTDGTLRSTEDVLNDVADGMANVKNPADRVRVAFDLFGKAGAGMVNMLQGGSEELNKLRGQFSDLTIEMTGDQAKAVEDANDRFDLLRRIFNSIGQQITATLLPTLSAIATVLTTVVIAAIDLSISAVRGLGNAFIGLFNLLSGPKIGDIEKLTFGETFQNQIRKIVTEIDGLPNSVDPVKKITADVGLGFDRTASATEKAADALRKYSESAKEVEANLQTAALNGLRQLETGLVSIIDGTKDAKTAFKDMARSIVNDLLKIAIQKSITGPLGDAFGSMFGKAIGGPVQRNTPVLVGERGPEVFLPASSGSIVPNKSMAGGGGVVVNQTINVSTGVSQTVRNEIAQLMPQISQSAKAAVLDAKQRGGSFSKAF